MEEKFMKIALKEAEKAFNKDEIPVGAVIVKDNKTDENKNRKETLIHITKTLLEDR